MPDPTTGISDHTPPPARPQSPSNGISTRCQDKSISGQVPRHIPPSQGPASSTIYQHQLQHHQHDFNDAISTNNGEMPHYATTSTTSTFSNNNSITSIQESSFLGNTPPSAFLVKCHVAQLSPTLSPLSPTSPCTKITSLSNTTISNTTTISKSKTISSTTTIFNTIIISPTTPTSRSPAPKPSLKAPLPSPTQYYLQKHYHPQRYHHLPNHRHNLQHKHHLHHHHPLQH
ncbi:hybrid signal transduction histidine kinase I-like [Penaeus chinensis]|uniref:hybrid signal transduction histidine kinase I-like n=1 Tax=Penaeus chinensis TaxID=139456 RepID=UPI001FB78F33|nr:hybrid signal transduction histidine kinase I-like [Penaeus chinensis]